MMQHTRHDGPREPRPPTEDDWATLVQLDPREREIAMLTYYTELAHLPEDERRARLRKQVAAAYVLPDEDLRPLTLARLRAWLQMEPEAAATVASSFDAVMREVNANVAMRRVGFVQTLMREFSDQEQQRLRLLNPEERARGLVLTNLGGFAEPTAS